MIFYLSASSNSDVEDYIIEKNMNRLFSFYSDKNRLSDYFEHPFYCVFLDSGAFSAYSKGLTLDVKPYCEYLLQHSDKYDVIAALDIIGSSEQCSAQNMENYIYMRDNLPASVLNKVIPTFHYGENFNQLHTICNYCDDKGGVTYIGIGGIAPIKNTSIRDAFLQECFDIIPSDMKVHLFGVSDLALLNKYYSRVYSADSSTWNFAAINGELISDYGRLIVSNKRTTIDPLVSDYVKTFGYDIKVLSEDVKERKKFNIDYLNHWLSTRTQKSNTTTQLKLF